jgi:hypothetical protein
MFFLFCSSSKTERERERETKAMRVKERIIPIPFLFLIFFFPPFLFSSSYSFSSRFHPSLKARDDRGEKGELESEGDREGKMREIQR